MTDFVTGFSAVAAAVLFVAGLADLVMTWSPSTKAKEAVVKATAVADTANASKESLSAHSGIDFKGNWEALAALAAALKDLDRSTRLFTLSLAFLAVAGATIGLTTIGDGLAAT